MFCRRASRIVLLCRRYTCDGGDKNKLKVAVIGGAGGIGQPLALLLKTSDLFSDIVLHDLAKHTPGVGIDLSHIDTDSTVTSFVGPDKLCESMTGAKIVLLPAGVPRKPGMTRDDLFAVNAKVVFETALAMSMACPDAILAIITNPVNAVVPLASEVLKQKGCLNPNKLFGISLLDVIRSSTFVGNLKGISPRKVSVPCVGGHAGTTIIPLLSKTKPEVQFGGDEIKSLTERIQNAGTEVVKGKAGAGSATLSMGYAAYRFACSLAKGLKGEKNIIECAYVMSCVTESPFFSSPLSLGKEGIEKNLGLPECLSDFENNLIKEAIPQLKKSIEKGIKFAQENIK